MSKEKFNIYLSGSGKKYKLDHKTHKKVVTPRVVKDGVSNISFDPEFNTLYTIICVNPDAPEPNKPFHRNWLQWMMINIDMKDVLSNFGQNAEEIVPFGLFKGISGCQRYVFYLFKQVTGRIANPYLSYHKRCNLTKNYDYNRCGFNLDEFVRRYGLCYVVHRTLVVSYGNTNKSECNKIINKKIPHNVICPMNRNDFVLPRSFYKFDLLDNRINMFGKLAKNILNPSRYVWNHKYF